jgi:hypothetical protein
MMLRVSLLAGFALVAVLALLLWGPRAVVSLTDRPLIYDCGGVNPEICAEIYRDALDRRYGSRSASGPITYFKVVPVGHGPAETSGCNAVSVERGSFTFGVFASISMPLCG